MKPTKKTTKTPKLDPATLRWAHAQVRALEKSLEDNAKRAAREGGVLLAHAASEHARATACAMVLTTIIEPAMDAMDATEGS